MESNGTLHMNIVSWISLCDNLLVMMQLGSPLQTSSCTIWNLIMTSFMQLAPFDVFLDKISLTITSYNFFPLRFLYLVYCYCLTFSLFGLFILDIFTKFIFFNISYMYNLWHKELRYIRTKSTFSHSNITGTPHIHVMGRNPLQIYLINQVCYKS